MFEFGSRHLLQRINTGIKHSLMVQWVVGSILHGRPIELFIILAIAPRLM